MRITVPQRKFFIENGYIHLPGVVPPIMVREARRAINHSLGEKGMAKDQLHILRQQTYCPELRRQPVLLDLVNKTPALAIAESLLAPGTLAPAGGCQVALRFPSLTPGELYPHIDGTYAPNNGVPAGCIDHFTMLAGVLLSDMTEPKCGNFTVWPGTHRLFEAYFRQHTPQSLLNGMPEVDLPEPVAIQGRAGDVVLTHYQLAHCGGPHIGPDIRYALFFRFARTDHARFGWDVMTDIWAEWDGLRDLVGERSVWGD
jgi:Phytanoyl-CoA dioxygenase (PhyH)